MKLYMFIAMIIVVASVQITRVFWGKILKDKIETARMRFDDPEGCAAAFRVYLKVNQLFCGMSLMFIPRECRQLDIIHSEAVASLMRRIRWEHLQFMSIRMNSDDTSLLIVSIQRRNRRSMFRDLRQLIEISPSGPVFPRYIFQRRADVLA